MSATAAPTVSKVTRDFEFKLAGKDIELKAHEMSDLLAEVEKLEQEQKESNAAFKTKIDERYKKIGELGKAVRAGTETRTLEAEMRKDFATATKRFFFDGKQIHEEAMTAEELQMDFGDIQKPKKPAKTARDGRLEDAQRAIASKKKGKSTTAEVVKLETSRKSKRSPVDGLYR